MTKSLLQIAQKAQAQLESIMPGKVQVKLEKNPATGKNELVGYYMDRGSVNFKREQLMGNWVDCLDLFFSYFNKRKEYIMSSAEKQQEYFDAGVHPEMIKIITLDC